MTPSGSADRLGGTRTPGRRHADGHGGRRPASMTSGWEPPRLAVLSAEDDDRQIDIVAQRVP
jgi:hypothetical protein